MIDLRTCESCAITSAEVPMYLVGERWLCGPRRCGAVESEERAMTEPEPTVVDQPFPWEDRHRREYRVVKIARPGINFRNFPRDDGSWRRGARNVPWHEGQVAPVLKSGEGLGYPIDAAIPVAMLTKADRAMIIAAIGEAMERLAARRDEVVALFAEIPAADA